MRVVVAAMPFIDVDAASHHAGELLNVGEAQHPALLQNPILYQDHTDPLRTTALRTWSELVSELGEAVKSGATA
jgi:hypothetical protein